MKTLSAKDIIDFRRKSDRGKKSFVERIKSNKIEHPSDGGGDYWVSSLSAVCNSFKQDNLSLIEKKGAELQNKLNATKYSNTKKMYEQNLKVLNKYKNMDIKKLRPDVKLSFLKKSSGNPILTIKGLQIEAKPSHIYTFGKKDGENIGATWFTAKVNGYRIEEVAMICDLLYRFLKYNYLKKYQLDPSRCIAVDMISGHSITYSEIENGEFFKVLNPTIDEIVKLM